MQPSGPGGAGVIPAGRSEWLAPVGAKAASCLQIADFPRPLTATARKRASQAKPAPRLLTVSDVAEYLSVRPAFVYEHATAMGAERLGNGSKAPLRFRVEKVDAWLGHALPAGAEGARTPPGRFIVAPDGTPFAARAQD
jgi:hypothetical protein